MDLCSTGVCGYPPSTAQDVRAHESCSGARAHCPIPRRCVDLVSIKVASTKMPRMPVSNQLLVWPEIMNQTFPSAPRRVESQSHEQGICGGPDSLVKSTWDLALSLRTSAGALDLMIRTKSFDATNVESVNHENQIPNGSTGIL